MKVAAACAFLAIALSSAVAQHQHDSKILNERGALAMGFDQEKTAHHFLLRPTGGEIVVAVKDPNDSASIDEIQMHLQHIARAFAAGDFGKPQEVHAETPDGVAELQKLRAAIKYRYAADPQGARVVISSDKPEAVRAIHKFLRYQIEEHKTGDPLQPAAR